MAKNEIGALAPEKTTEAVPSREDVLVAMVVGMKDGLKRRIIRLWPDAKDEKSIGLPVYFRCNFHNPEAQGAIVKSCFVVVANNKAIVEWETEIPPKK